MKDNNSIKTNSEPNPKHPSPLLGQHIAPASDRPNAADAALDLIAAKVLDALLAFDWAAWKRRYASKPGNLADLVTILARLSREALAREKFRAELSAQQTERDKRAPTLEEFEQLERTLKLL